jgi:hypothetical protein
MSVLAVARSVRIEDELARRGVKLRGRADRCGPCPRCGGDDRFSINVKKQVFNCRQCGAKGGGSIDLVMFLDGCDFNGAVTYFAGASPERTGCSIRKQPDQAVKKCEEKDNAHKATWLWSRRNPIAENCPAGLYLRKTRGYSGPIPSTLGYLPANDKHPHRKKWQNLAYGSFKFVRKYRWLAKNVTNRVTCHVTVTRGVT